MCELCKNTKCSLAGKRNLFMDGKRNVCSSFDSGEPKPDKDYLEEWIKDMKNFNIGGLPL